MPLSNAQIKVWLAALDPSQHDIDRLSWDFAGVDGHDVKDETQFVDSSKNPKAKASVVPDRSKRRVRCCGEGVN